MKRKGATLLKWLGQRCISSPLHCTTWNDHVRPAIWSTVTQSSNYPQYAAKDYVMASSSFMKQQTFHTFTIHLYLYIDFRHITVTLHIYIYILYYYKQGYSCSGFTSVKEQEGTWNCVGLSFDKPDKNWHNKGFTALHRHCIPTFDNCNQKCNQVTVSHPHFINICSCMSQNTGA